MNSPTYGVSSFLAKILSPVVGNTEKTVKNSCHFAEFVRGKKTLKADRCWYHLMSFPCLQTSQLILPSIDILLQHLNSIEPSIQFTVEREINGHLAFLGLNVHRTVEGKLETDVYRKSTHTDKYLSSPSKP
jgi:hypothetical protein